MFQASVDECYIELKTQKNEVIQGGAPLTLRKREESKGRSSKDLKQLVCGIKSDYPEDIEMG
jgi:hypothetical protein